MRIAYVFISLSCSLSSAVLNCILCRYIQNKWFSLKACFCFIINSVSRWESSRTNDLVTVWQITVWRNWFCLSNTCTVCRMMQIQLKSTHSSLNFVKTCSVTWYAEIFFCNLTRRSLTRHLDMHDKTWICQTASMVLFIASNTSNSW